MNILLVEPKFPIPPKSKNHKNFLPIGLLKIATYLHSLGNKIRLIRGVPENPQALYKLKKFSPDEIWVTSLFTYWASYVKESVLYYRALFPKAKIIVGGIYASLLPAEDIRRFTTCDDVRQGVIEEAENLKPAYGLIKRKNNGIIDYQILHTSRGCERKCHFCGTWKIEPNFKSKSSIRNEIISKKLVFYDNNLLMGSNIENILHELIDMKKKRKITWCESQSGFDGRVLLKKPYLAEMLKSAGFQYPRIAWDGKYEEHDSIFEQIRILKDAHFSMKDIYVFMIYNCNISFQDMEKKRIKCFEWKVQISDCRFRPLNQLFDHFSALKGDQTSIDYYIHKQWSDSLVKQFRKNVRQQNICTRQGLIFYSKSLEQKRFGKDIFYTIKRLKTKSDVVAYLKKQGIDYWFPDQIRYPMHYLNNNANIQSLKHSNAEFVYI